MLPLIEGPRTEQYDAIYGAYKSVIYQKVPVTLLFNLKEGPDEVDNLAGQEKYAPVIAKLKTRLKDLQKETWDLLEL